MGSKKYVKVTKIFYSLTFGGETLSLSGSIATLKLIDKYKICQKIKKNGSKIINEIEKKIKSLNLNDYINLSGYSGKVIFNFKNQENAKAEALRIFWISKLIQKGVLNNGIQILSFSHNDMVITKLIKTYNEILDEIKFNLNSEFFLEKFKNIKLNKDLRR